MTKILTPVSTDHCPALFSLSKKKPVSEVNKFGNFRTPQLKTKTILTEIKMIHSFCTTGKSLSKCQLKWKLSKYEF